MFKVAAVLSGLLLVAAPDTLWWRTQGGTVVGHHEGSRLSCTLTMEDPSGRITFAWGGGLPLRATAEGTGWRLEPDVIARVAVRIGADWLANGSGEPNITALTGPSAFMFVLDEPVEDRLQEAREVTVETPAGRISIGLAASRIQALLAALDKCRRIAS